ncbi:zinc finger protein ZAT1-like [Actinidia eriantha]|uniref:zinc finger protein ZAT1-like n=1 Tax=Actinidia eriantha TaxID=165200 RepID=UPI0025845D50|nr:zinc finger protein ZAT1-like [Actinidia eriantha]
MDDDQENHKKRTLIKLKIQKYVEEEKVDPIIGPRSNDGPRVCNVCNKGFGSGKALGGHMRVHAQAHKERSPNNDRSNGEESDRTSCSICRKKFPSMKSLFGHMRCHPEREWRGIQPPAPAAAANTASSTLVSGPSDDLNGTIDLAKSLPSWPSTDRRGRRALTCCHDSSTFSEVEEEERIREAVHDLMRLARGESLHQVEATNSNSPTNRAEIEEYLSVKKLKIDERGRGNISGDTEEKGKLMTAEEEGPNVDYNLGERVKIMSKKKRKKVKLINLESVSTPPERYKCSTCNKFFSTHQALGGHRSSHNKIKNDEDEHNANHAPTLVDEVVPKEIIEGGGSSSYKCKICNKSFPTGQALGGHKRSHWSGPVEGTASQTESLGEASETGRRILGFDLNEVPPMDYEEVGGCGYHDPSSSYNSAS